MLTVRAKLIYLAIRLVTIRPVGTLAASIRILLQMGAVAIAGYQARVFYSMAATRLTLTVQLQAMRGTLVMAALDQGRRRRMRTMQMETTP
jgi:hypothetical protein